MLKIEKDWLQTTQRFQYDINLQKPSLKKPPSKITSTTHLTNHHRSNHTLQSSHPPAHLRARTSSRPLSRPSPETAANKRRNRRTSCVASPRAYLIGGRAVARRWLAVHHPVDTASGGDCARAARPAEDSSVLIGRPPGRPALIRGAAEERRGKRRARGLALRRFAAAGVRGRLSPPLFTPRGGRLLFGNRRPADNRAVPATMAD